MSKGGGSSGTQQVEQTTTNLPEYARPFYESLLGRATYESERGYEGYPGQRIADFNDYENAGMQGMADMAMQGDPEQFNQASYIASQVGAQNPNQAGSVVDQYQPNLQGSEYFAGNIDSGYNAGDMRQGYQAGQRGMGYQAGNLQSDFNAGKFDPNYQAQQRSSGFNPEASSSGYQGSNFDPGYFAKELGQDYSARDLNSEYTGQFNAGPSFEAGTLADSGVIQDYMNPYQQLVTDVEKREVQRAADIQGANIGAQAAQSGGLGGYREAIMLSEQDRNLQQQLGDVQARGDQASFAQAQQAFEADRAARLSASQMGLQQGVAGDSSSQQAEQLRQSAFGATEQARQAQQNMAISSFEAGERAKQQAAQLGMTAQQQEDASRQAQEQFRQGSFGQTQQGQIQSEKFKADAFNAGESARQQAASMGMNAQQQEEASRQASEQFRQSAFSQTQSFRQAQEQFGQAQFGQNEQLRMAQQQENRAVFEANQRAQQEGARLGLSAQEIQERVNQAQNAARMQARDTNNQNMLNRANLGMQGIDSDRANRDQMLRSSEMLGQLGGQSQKMGIERLRNLQAAGQNQRGMDQRSMDMGYEDFLRQQSFGREQLGLLSNMLQGVPITAGSTTASFGGGASPYSQALGAGIGGVGLYNAMG